MADSFNKVFAESDVLNSFHRSGDSTFPDSAILKRQNPTGEGREGGQIQRQRLVRFIVDRIRNQLIKVKMIEIKERIEDWYDCLHPHLPVRASNSPAVSNRTKTILSTCSLFPFLFLRFP